MKTNLRVASGLLGALLWLSGGVSASAQSIKSEYTSLDLDKCLLLVANDFEAEFACAGYKGYPVRVLEADLRFYISYGFGADREMAAHQTLPQFNRVHTTLEWRMRNDEGRYLPFATILRWFTEAITDSPAEQYLVVTQLASDNSCHIGYVNASKLNNANERAREIADALGGRFDCANDEPLRLP